MSKGFFGANAHSLAGISTVQIERLLEMHQVNPHV
jgi:hypothetical protein